MTCRAFAEMLQANSQCECIPVTAPQAALRLLQQARFDVFVIAIESAFDTAFMLEVHRLNPALGIVVLLESPDRAIVLQALASGARGIFHRADSLGSLWDCIRCVHAGQVWAHSAEIEYVLDVLFDHATRAEQLQGATTLSRREEEIARLVAEGRSNRQISSLLGLSEHTIKNYLFRIFEKLGISSRVQLALRILGKASSVLAHPIIQDSLTTSAVRFPTSETNGQRRVFAFPLGGNYGKRKTTVI
jgi:two-component system, NarL family, nitrate/nitrite response regulator NarL